MKVTELSTAWQKGHEREERSREYRLRMPLEDAARLAALSELYPQQKESDILNDMLGSALEELTDMKSLKTAFEGPKGSTDRH